jgi:hypothetical protein
MYETFPVLFEPLFILRNNGRKQLIFTNPQIEGAGSLVGFV